MNSIKYICIFIILSFLLYNISCITLANVNKKYQIPFEIKNKYEYLTEQKVEKIKDNEWRFGKARLWKVHNINILYLEGDKYEMAYQHGILLKDEILKGSLNQASKITYNAILNNLDKGILSNIIYLYTKRFILESMLNYALKKSQEDPVLSLLEAYGLSQATGISPKIIIYAALNPESAQTLLGITEKNLVGSNFINSCTDFTVWGSYSKNNKIIIGRNTDYPLNGFYDTNHTVIYFNPTNSDNKYMTVTTAGFHNAGVYGINEYGIYIGIHTVPSVGVSAKGFPVFMIGQEVLKKAKNFDDAKNILTQYSPAAGWSYHVVSYKEKKIATFEMTNAQTRIIYPQKEYHITTNHWRHPDMQKFYLHINHSVDEDTEARYKRVQQMILNFYNNGGMHIKDAISILADKYDPIHNKITFFPNTIATPYTVGSSVFVPEDKKLYVANGLAPSSHGDFIELDDIQIFDPNIFNPKKLKIISNDTYKKQYSSNQAKAEQIFIEAKKVFEYHNDYKQAKKFLKEALKYDSDNNALTLVYILFCIKNSDFKEALDILNIFITKLDPKSHYYYLSLYLRARIFGHYGEVDKSQKDLDMIISAENVDSKIKEATNYMLNKIQTFNRVIFRPTDIAVMMIPGDCFRYKSILN